MAPFFTEMKSCTRCGEAKPTREFGPLGVAPSGLNYWCRACVNAYYRDRRVRLGLNKTYAPRVCDECGEVFAPHCVQQRFCDNRCGHRFHRRKSAQPWNERRRANDQRRRALKKAAPVGAPVLLEEIRERDGNRCGICGGRVNGVAYPDPLSASLDHVVPLSAGGAHDPANVQLAHLRCNVQKGARGGGEQLRIL